MRRSVSAGGPSQAAPTSAASAATAETGNRKDLQVFNDISKAVTRYVHFTVFDSVDASVKDGVVTLTGTVPTEADRRKAADLAAITGVSRVDNQLIVDLNATGTAGKVEGKVDKGAEKTKSGVDKAIDKSAEGVNTAWEKTKEGANTAWVKTKEGSAKAADKSADGVARAGEAITDTYIKTRVHTKFVDEDLLKGSDMSVDVQDHVVTLSGTVPSEAGRDRAIEQTKKVDGVHKIVDKLMIGPKK